MSADAWFALGGALFGALAFLAMKWWAARQNGAVRARTARIVSHFQGDDALGRGAGGARDEPGDETDNGASDGANAT